MRGNAENLKMQIKRKEDEAKEAQAKSKEEYEAQLERNTDEVVK